MIWKTIFLIMGMCLLTACIGGDGGGKTDPPDPHPETPVINQAPIAKAERLSGIKPVMGDTIELDGSKSSDPENHPLTYQWTMTGRPDYSKATLINADTPTPSFTIDREGMYGIKLVVSDGIRNSEPDKVFVESHEWTLTGNRPQCVTMDPYGILYLKGEVGSRIYRWFIPQDNPLEFFDIRIGVSTNISSYEPTGHQIFIEDINNIFSINLENGSDRRITSTEYYFDILEIAENYLVACERRGNNHIVYTLDGNQVDHQIYDYAANHMTWNPSKNRMYYLGDIDHSNPQEPDHLYYDDIDPDTGTITASGESPDNGNHTMIPPMIISHDGNHLLLGSGDIYDAHTLERVDGFVHEITDAVWTDSGIATIRSHPDNPEEQTLFEIQNNNQVTEHQQTFEGEPMHLVKWQDTYAIITLIIEGSVNSNNGQTMVFCHRP